MILCYFVETFGPKYCPIVEFAVDNIQTLKQRRAKLEAHQQINHGNPEELQPNDDSNLPEASPKKMKSRIRNCDAPFSGCPLTTRQLAEYSWMSGNPTPLTKIGQSLLCTGSNCK